MMLPRILSSCLVGFVLCGCAKSPDSAPTADSAVRLKSKPAGALNVAEARKDVKDKQDIVLVGRIGGEEKPFVDGVAAFTVVDLSLKSCAADEGCPTPWDYCCVTDQLPANKAFVKVVDASGKPIASSAKDLLGAKELSVVTVQGKASRDEAGNLTVLASGVFVE